MNKKKAGCAVIGIMLMAGLCGCQNALPDMTAAEEQEIGEYAAVMLLKYDANSRSRLIDLPEELLNTSVEESPAPVETPSGMDPVAETPVVEIGEETPSGGASTIANAVGLPEEISVVYQDYIVSDTYPEGDAPTEYFSLDSTEGNKLLVLRFQMTNQSSEAQAIDLLHSNILYRVTVNDYYIRNALTTLLLNDLSTYSGTLEPGASQEVVLLLEVDTDTAAQISNISMEIRKDSNRVTISLF